MRLPVYIDPRPDADPNVSEILIRDRDHRIVCDMDSTDFTPAENLINASVIFEAVNYVGAMIEAKRKAENDF